MLTHPLKFVYKIYSLCSLFILIDDIVYTSIIDDIAYTSIIDDIVYTSIIGILIKMCLLLVLAPISRLSPW
jgi:hypothetical protein